MSKSFEIFPTNQYIPTYNEVINLSKRMFQEYMMTLNIKKDLDVVLETFRIHDNSIINKIYDKEKINISKEEYAAFCVNEEGFVNLFYHTFSELDEQFWNDEIQYNERAKNYIKDIELYKKLGYSWLIKKNAGQPPVVNLYFGYIGIAIANLTEGVIYSDDGGWEYQCFPVKAKEFKEKYLNISTLQDNELIEYIKNNVEKLRK
ncbi:hypothetical protein R2R35_22810 [Anaerocolumna sp. AGMB13020]|uniref:hypothetical protein n=1 Tax=Anaerocolumna sp. AGMB13020 TaxID=3081750 RepID=UPI0029547F0A|nr:hypothetical protein [Anaerocolumna sp. AGMB13020]WOO36589.1 hypothetical protein R2R35_22810 [Anaerocolumna sp. AGMB13020]